MSSGPSGFVHSVRVPSVYKSAARIVQKVLEESASLKDLIYKKKVHNITSVYRLAITTLQNVAVLDDLLRKSRLLFKENRLDPYLTRILMTELLWGNKGLKSECKPVQIILTYETELRALLQNVDPSMLHVNTPVKKPRYVRINTLISKIDDTISSFMHDGWIFIPKSSDYSSFLCTVSQLDDSSFIQDFHIPELLVFPPGTKFHNDHRYLNGSIVLQDKASCLPAFLLNPEPTSTVLDMCAAPGMKTSHLAAIMENRGIIIAVEKNPQRYMNMCYFTNRLNTTCVTNKKADALTVNGNHYPAVEYILVDPSCSGSGIIDRVEDPTSNYTSERLKNLRSFQAMILRHALCKFPRVKRVVYSTCSIFPEENEMVVDEMLADLGKAYKLVSVKKLLKGQWKNFSGKEFACKDRCLYSKPDIDHSNGFFVAVFERNFKYPIPEALRVKHPAEECMQNRILNSTERSNKKWKKRSKTSDSIADEICNGLEMIVVSEDKETNRNKRKRAEQENTEFTNTMKTDSGIDMDDVAIEMKTVKKKKKKEIIVETPVEAVDSTEIMEIVPEKDLRLKEKNRKRSKVDNSMEIEEDTSVNSESLIIPSRKKKKKKKRIPVSLEE